MAKIGFVLSHEQFLAPRLIEFGPAAEQAGFDMVWTSDHFHPWQDNQGHSGQAWITLAALGQRMGRIPMGTGVTCPTYRYHPAVVAQAFASLGILYPGRVFLGLGTGEALNEETATGQWGEYDERAARFTDALEIIQRLWTGDWVSYKGEYLSIKDARLYDLPDQRVPMYLAASGENSMKIAGKYGDGLISDTKSIQDKDLRAAYEEAVEEAGKDLAAMEMITEQFVTVGTMDEARTAAEKWRFLPKAWDPYVNNPDPRDIQRHAEKEVSLDEVCKSWIVSEKADDHVQGIVKLLDQGITQVFIHSGQEDQHRVIQFYAEEVLPQVRKERGQ